MFSFLSRKKPTTARINALPVITVNPKETLLQAALREGIDFPHSCRVGGCAACKCKLVEGKVKELTQTAYILSDEDLDQGYILACQSVPQTDIKIEVDLSRQQAHRQVTGRVIAQERLTHDITLLRVQLDESLPYKAGQFANISVAPLSELSRSYSFATAAQPDSQVSFYVRKVSGGAFSTMINESDVLGKAVTVDGPMGDFWLRPADAPMMLVAGGSGLAPIVALLQEAIKEGVSRSVTLLFGAREEKDLYALDAIREIAARWKGGFTFVPVLSAAAADASWKGERGMVGDKISALIAPGSHAYLCGPPQMIDACSALLQQHGVSREHIHADRFTTLHDAPSTAS
jgi:NAD(P)H-flavin reductase/ferredoxin